MRTSLISLAAALTLLASGAASAQMYVGGGIGMGRIGVDCSGATTCDKTATGGKLYGGYMANTQLGVELVYIDWGKATASGSLTPASWREAPMAMTTASGSLRATGFGLDVAYFTPMSGNWTGALRAGILQSHGKISIDGISGSMTKNSIQPHFGFGVGYKLGPALVLTGEADFSRMKWGADPVFETDSVHLFSVGVRYGF